jgi:hypothetical protein
MWGLVGAPVELAIDPKGMDSHAAQRLWKKSEELIGMEWPKA